MSSKPKKLTPKQAKLVKVADLENWENNPRLIKDDRYQQLLDSINELGFNDVLKLAADGKTVIGGNMRLKALQELGIEQVQAIITDATTPEQIFKIAIRDNEAFGEYDRDQLVELAYSLEIPNLDLDTFMVHLDKPQSIADIIKEDTTEDIEEDEAPEVSSEPPISELGKIYQLGRHRVMCGDSTKDLDKLLDGIKIDLVHTDPPYGIDADKMTMGSGVKEFHRGNWDNTAPDVTYLLELADKVCIWGGNYFTDMLPINNDWLCWYKKNDNLSFSEFELAWTNYGKNTRHISHHWGAEKKQHVTMKPIEVCAWAIKLAGKANTILDTYLGSGSTLIACEQTDRTCYGMELDPKYVDVIRKRYAKFVEPDEWEETWESLTPAKN